MTACNNNVRGGKASRVITAALVATLSVGTPMAAIASTVSEGGIDMLATDAENVKQGTVSYDGKDGASFVYDEETHGLVPTSLKLGNGTVVDDIELSPVASKREAGSYYYFYVALDGRTYSSSFDQGAQVEYENDGESVNLAAAKLVGTVDSNQSSQVAYETPSAIGKYAVVVAYAPTDAATNGALNYVGTAATFSITSQELSGATIYEKNADDTADVSDVTFNYDGTPASLDVDDVKAKICVAVDGAPLDASKYSISIWKKGSNTEITSAAGESDYNNLSDDLNVGETYIVKISGQGEYTNQTKECELVINKLDLSTSVFDVNTITEAPGNNDDAPMQGSALSTLVKSINDVDAADFDVSNVDVTFVKDPNGYQTSNGTRGAYTFTISAKKDNEKVTGSKTITVLYADYAPNITFEQDGSAADADAAADGTYSVDLSSDDVEYFDADKISVKYNSTETLKASDYTVTYSDKDGKTVDASALKQPGEYKVTVTVNVKKGSNVIAGTKTLDVKVSYGTVTQNANIFVSYDGENVPSVKNDLTYSGEDLAKNITVLAKNGEKTFVEGTDYEVSLQKSVDGKNVDVDTMVDAGDYTLTVKALTFKIGGASTATFTFKVSPITIDKVVVDYTIVDTAASNNKTCFPYTGSVITPSFKFYDQNAKGDVTIDGTRYTEVNVPADAYTVEYTLHDEKAELNEVGDYVATLKTAKDEENYVVNFNNVAIKVSDENIMKDVPNTAWYAQSVLDAKNRNLMMGIEGTDFFAPLQSLNRGQVAIVLYRMAGSPAISTTPGSGDTTGSWDNQNFETGFSDVASNSYYAQEIAWAKTAGVVNGNPDGTFAPDASISRQQFAIMLANYAKTIGKYQAVDTEAVLANVAGGDEVEGYARDAVAWAVSNGLMAQGSDVNPLGTIDRAQAATMLVRFDDFVKGETK